MDDEFVSRIASLERSVQSVGQGRERYLSSAVSSALSRGVGSGGGGNSASSSKFHITFPGNSSSSGNVGGDRDRTVDFVDYSAYDHPAAGRGGGSSSSSHYDPNAVPPHTSMRKPPSGTPPPQHAAGAADTMRRGYDLYAIDPTSEAYAVCPRCAHLDQLEASVAVVEEQYRAEVEHLRKMVGQVDADRLDVVQRLGNAQEGLESMRSQLLDKDRILNDWRQRAIVAEEALTTSERVHTSALWDVQRHAQFTTEQLMSVVLNAETNCRTEIVAGEHVTRTAWWSTLESGLLYMHRTAHIAKLRLEQERYARKTLELKEADAELRRQMEALERNHVDGRRMRRDGGAGRGGWTSSTSSGRKPPADDAPQTGGQRRQSSFGFADGATAAVALRGTVGDDDASAPAVLHRCLSDPNIPNDLHDLDSTEPVKQPAGHNNAPASRERSPGAPVGPSLSRLADDVSFGDLEIEDDDALLLPSSATGGDSAHQSDVQRWQRLLAESDTARRQLEGHLMTEQHYSNELQLEVDDLMVREGEGEEAFRRTKMELLELAFRLELVLQSHRRLEHPITQTQAAAPLSGSPTVASPTATTTPNNNSSADGEDVATMHKELRVLRQLYTAAKEDAIAARKELQDLQLLSEHGGGTADLAMQPVDAAAPTAGGAAASSSSLPAAMHQQLTADAVAQAVLRQLSPQFASMQSTLGSVLQQLTVVGDQEDDDDDGRKSSVAAMGTDADADGATKSVVDMGSSRMGSTPSPQGAASSASASGPGPASSSTGVAPPLRTSGGGFAALLLQRVQSATRMHHDSVRSMLEQSIHETDAKMNELADQLRTSLRPTPNTTMLDTSIQPTHHRAAHAGSGGSLTPGPLEGVSSSRTSTPVNLPNAVASDGHHQQQHPTQPTASVVQQSQQQRDALSLTKLQEALASMRNIMRNVLFSTSHNQKLLGEKLDELSIGQKSMMSELVASSASFPSQRHDAYPPQHYGGGGGGGGNPLQSPTFSIGRQGSVGGTMGSDAVLGVSGSNNGSLMASPLQHAGGAVQYSVPPALQQRASSAQQAAVSTGRAQPVPRASVPALSHEEAAYVVEQFVDSEREQSGQRSSSGSAPRGGDLLSPPAPPLPNFNKVAVAAPAPAPAAASGASGSSSGGLPSLQRRPSHKWDDEEEESPLAVRRSAESTTAKRSWHKVKSPYEEDSD